MRLTIRKKTISFLLSLVLLSGCLLVLATHDQRQVLLPVLTAVAIAGLMIVKSWNRTDFAPLFDIGCITAFATLIYTIIPPLQYLLSGMQHTVLSAPQLYILDPNPDEMGAFTWRYTIYLASFVAGYVALPDPPEIRTADPVSDPATTRIFVGVYLVMLGFIFGVNAIYGVDPNVVYERELLGQASTALKNMPLILQQIFSNVFSMFYFVKLGLMMILVLNWKKRSCRFVLYAWLALLLIGYIVKMGARTELVLTFFAVTIMYHRFVRPLGVGRLVLAGGVVLAGFFIFGAMRGQSSLKANVEYLKTVTEHGETLFSLGTEFQHLFAGAYDLLWMKEHGLIENVPLQFLFFDAVMLVPQQFLPFTKIDVQNWYIELSANPGYFMFNPIAQSVLGFGWADLIIRGALIGLTFAWLRRWYLRNSSDFWSTLLYCFLIIQSYYTIRSSPFYSIAHLLIYVVAPLYFLVWILTKRRWITTEQFATLYKILEKLYFSLYPKHNQ